MARTKTHEKAIKLVQSILDEAKAGAVANAESPQATYNQMRYIIARQSVPMAQEVKDRMAVVMEALSKEL